MSAPVSRTVRLRECAREGCPIRYDPFGTEHPCPPRWCSLQCWRASKPAKAAKPRARLRTDPTPAKRQAISPAAPVQRAAVKDRACIVCAQHAGDCHPAHLIDRSVLGVGQDDPRAVVPLCPQHHAEYDDGELSILEHLEPHWREHLAFAVERHGLLRTLQRVTNQHWRPVEDERSAA